MGNGVAWAIVSFGSTSGVLARSLRSSKDSTIGISGAPRRRRRRRLHVAWRPGNRLPLEEAEVLMEVVSMKGTGLGNPRLANRGLILPLSSPSPRDSPMSFGRGRVQAPRLPRWRPQLAPQRARSLLAEVVSTSRRSGVSPPSSFGPHMTEGRPLSSLFRPSDLWEASRSAGRIIGGSGCLSTRRPRGASFAPSIERVRNESYHADRRSSQPRRGPP
jgi:hypothetical protein